MAIWGIASISANSHGTALHPVMPSEGGVHSPALILMAIISGAIGSFGNLKYTAYVHEKGWRSLSHLRPQRFDLIISMLGMFLMLALIQVAAAGALKPRGIQVEKIDDLVPIFAQVLGTHGRILFGVALWCVVFAQHVGSGSAHGIMISDAYHRFIRPYRQLTDDVKTPGEMPAYRWLILYVCLSPLYVFLTDWSPIGMVFAYGVLRS